MLLWAIVVSYSRIYLGVHYPGDILTGMLIGAVFGYLAALFHKYLMIRFKVPVL